MNRDDDSTKAAAGSELPVDDALILEAACNRFEKAWRHGGRPDLLAAVADLPASVRGAAARELVELEVYYRRRGGEAQRRPTTSARLQASTRTGWPG